MLGFLGWESSYHPGRDEKHTSLRGEQPSYSVQELGRGRGSGSPGTWIELLSSPPFSLVFTFSLASRGQGQQAATWQVWSDRGIRKQSLLCAVFWLKEKVWVYSFLGVLKDKDFFQED